MDPHLISPLIVDLSDAAATDATVVGAKAANLARAARAGLPVAPGFVVSTTAVGPELLPMATEAAVATWRSMGSPRVVVRSSSTVEDAGSSSMAGQFTSVLGVADAAGLADAVAAVAASASAGGRTARPMAVLVQPELAAACGGVIFGVDPVTGDTRTCVLDVAAGSPDGVVGGTVPVAHVVLGRRGAVRSWGGPPMHELLPWRRRRELVGLAHRAAAAFAGQPQDVEWACDHDGRLWLLQSRPVTATAEVPHGPLYGPGPLEETFPDALAPLEVELWIDPLREALVAALGVVGAVSEHRIRGSEVVVVVGGRPAVDLELIGAAPARHPGLRRLNPVGAAQRLLAAWRTGRLRAALPLLAGDLLEAVDRELQELPALAVLDDRELLALLEATRTDLRALHGYEMLCGMLLPATGGTTAIGLALRALAWERRGSASDEAVVAADPVVLALVPPRIGARTCLPPIGPAAGPRSNVLDLEPREALRLRCRWVQELGARAVEELVGRLSLAEPARGRELSLASLSEIVAGGPCVLPETPFEAGPPLPSAFRLAGPEAPRAVVGGTPDGLAASAGRAAGRVRHVDTPVTPGVKDVLVVGALVPTLATELERVAAIVSETGSPLSHLAILARERSVPVAVGVADARRRFPVGTSLLVDGSTGTVTVLGEGETA